MTSKIDYTSPIMDLSREKGRSYMTGERNSHAARAENRMAWLKEMFNESIAAERLLDAAWYAGAIQVLAADIAAQKGTEE